jgi:phage tail sheath gpL-like
MASLIVVDGLTADDKTPGSYGETKFGQGRVSIGSFAVKCLLIGYLLAAGSATADQDIDAIPGMTEAYALYGERSQLAVMAEGAFSAVGEGGVELWGAPTAEAGGGVTASITVTIDGATFSTNGSFDLYFRGKAYNITVLTTDTNEDVANRIESVLEADANSPALVAVAAGGVADEYVATITIQNKGEHGNQYYLAAVTSSAPSELEVTISGSPVAGTGGLYPFTSGAGAPTLTTLLALMEADEYDYIAYGFNDATSLAALEAYADAQALATVGHLEHIICATNDAYATAISRSATTLNAYRACMLWDEYQEAHPSEWAAEFAAIRASREGTNPWQNYIGQQLRSAQPKRYGPAIATHSELKAALNNGLSPVTTKGGECEIVRAIVTHCLSGSSPDYRCYDVPDAVVPDRVRKEVDALWAAWSANNPAVQDDPAEGENVPQGVGYPSLWNAGLYARLLRFQDENLWLQDVDDYPPTSAWDDDSKRIVSAIPLIVRPINAQLAFSVRQIAS